MFEKLRKKIKQFFCHCHPRNSIKTYTRSDRILDFYDYECIFCYKFLGNWPDVNYERVKEHYEKNGYKDPFIFHSDVAPRTGLEPVTV